MMSSTATASPAVRISTPFEVELRQFDLVVTAQLLQQRLQGLGVGMPGGRVHHQHRRQRVALERAQRLAEARQLLELGQRRLARDVIHPGDRRQFADFVGEFFDGRPGEVLLQEQRDLAAVLPAAGQALHVFKADVKAGRQRQRDADDRDGQGGGHGRAPELAECIEEDLRVAQEIVLDHALAPVSRASSPWFSSMTRRRARSMRCRSWVAISTVTPW
jgi:hypothetical protein